MKKIMSDQTFLPLKMCIIALILFRIYYYCNDYDFDYFNAIAYIFAGFILYSVLRVIANFLSFNPDKMNSDPYFMSSAIDKRIKNELSQYHLLENKKGVFTQNVKIDSNSGAQFYFEEIDHPEKLLYKLMAYEEILIATGTYSSELIIDKIKLYKEQLIGMIE
ncbi:hypothetical protein [Paenibacillus polymyxa]|uniref:hypothetical protein n=1 Tax=Paenibacillus polymyxa TaxID=1406 RepID=UPI0025B666F7|nr:hypothetical protein [Paenibacillus polymyxa]MDN4086030.1 hypothetical protein [Paenibacillus polymyxa]MDN4108351.1 hypothetical protein [Paenibacillus polymyxa]